MAHSNNWDETQPTNSTNATSIDDEIRKLRLDARERMAVDHYITSSDSAEGEIGIHKKITLKEKISTPSTTQNNQAIIHRLNTDYDGELRMMVQDANGVVVSHKLFFAGEVKMWLGLEANIPPGWLPMKGSTMGNTGSGATYAGTKYQDLFYHLWNNLDDTAAPVSTGRGASAADDFTANKTITIPDARSKMLIGAGQASGMTLRKEGYVGGGETKDVSHQHGAGTLSVPAHNHKWYDNTGGSDHDKTWDVSGNPVAIQAGTPDKQATQNHIKHTTGVGEAGIADAWTENEAAATPTGSVATGGSTTQDVMNPWIAIWMIIKY